MGPIHHHVQIILAYKSDIMLWIGMLSIGLHYIALGYVTRGNVARIMFLQQVFINNKYNSYIISHLTPDKSSPISCCEKQAHYSLSKYEIIVPMSIFHEVLKPNCGELVTDSRVLRDIGITSIMF